MDVAMSSYSLVARPRAGASCPHCICAHASGAYARAHHAPLVTHTAVILVARDIKDVTNVIVISEMPQKDCSVQVSITVQPDCEKLQVIVDVFMNSSGSTQGEGAAPPPEPDPALDSMHTMLEPHLRPISPDLNNEESKRIYEEHKQLAPEYLKVQTELAYLSNQKSELEAQMDEEELRQKREIIQLENEKESLIKLYQSLRKQLARVESNSWLPEDMPLE